MKHRPLGKTGLDFSEIAYGAGIAAGLFVSGTHEYQVRALSRAIELGINYFDTAPTYGDTVSETNLGAAFAEVQPKGVYVGTKVTLSLEELEDLKGAVRRSLQASLKRLRMNSVDIFYLHNNIRKARQVRKSPPPTNYTQVSLTAEDIIGPEGVADVMNDLKSEGLFKHTGFTASGEIEEVLKVIESGKLEVMQGYHSLLNPTAVYEKPDGFEGRDYRQYYKAAYEKGLGVVNIRAMGGGALAGAVSRTGLAGPVDNTSLTGFGFNREIEQGEQFEALVTGDVANRPEAAIRYAISNDYVSSVLIGFSNVEQMEAACAAQAKGPLSISHFDIARKIWASAFKL